MFNRSHLGVDFCGQRIVEGYGECIEEHRGNPILTCSGYECTEDAHCEDVEIFINGKGHHFVANENSDNFEKSLISAVDKIIVQVKKQHEKLVDH